MLLTASMVFNLILPFFSDFFVLFYILFKGYTKYRDWAQLCLKFACETNDIALTLLQDIVKTIVKMVLVHFETHRYMRVYTPQGHHYLIMLFMIKGPKQNKTAQMAKNVE